MWRALAFVLVLLTASPAVAQRIYNRQTGTIKNQSTPLTPGDCAVVDANGNDVSVQTCPGGGGGGDITDVWTDTSGGVDALTAAAGDTFDAGSADSSKPCKRGTALPGTCVEGDCFQDTDGGGLELYICTAANTWTKGMTGVDIDTSAELAALVTNETGTGQVVFSTTPNLDQPFITDFSLAGHSHTDVATGSVLNILDGTAGTLTLARGGTNQTTWTASRCVQVNAGGTALESASAACGTGGAPTTAQYIVGAADATLTAEQVLTIGAGTGLSLTLAGGDGGAATLRWQPSSRTGDVTLWDSTSASRALTAGLSGASDPVLTFSDNLIALSSRFKALSGNATFTADPGAIYGLADTYTMNYTGAQFLAFNPSATIVYNDDPLTAGPVFAFLNGITVKNETGDAMSLGLPWGYLDGQRVQADAAAVTLIGTESFTTSVQYETVSGGTLNVISQLGFSCVGTIGTGVTVQSRLCYRATARNGGAGTLETMIGFNIEAMDATQASIGLRNYSSTMWVPIAVQTVTSSVAINLDATGTTAGHHNTGTTIPLTAAGAVTINATPTIADPLSSMNGQMIVLVNTSDTHTITLRDESDLAGSNLQLRAATVAIPPNQSLTLIYNAAVGEWLDSVGASAGGGVSGTGTDNHLVRWDGTSAVQDTASLVAADDGSFTATMTSTSTTGLTGITSSVTGNHSSGSPTFYGARTFSTSSASAAVNGTFTALDALASCGTTNGCSGIHGLSGNASRDDNAGTVTNAVGLYTKIYNLETTGAITNSYGVYIDSPLNFGTITNAYALYSADSALSHFSGPVESVFTTTSTSTSVVGLTETLTINPGSATTADYRVARFGASTSGTAASGSTIFGLDVNVDCSTSNGCDDVTGIYGLVSKTGSGALPTASAVTTKLVNFSGTAISFGAGVTVLAPVGTITASYGIYVESSGGNYDAAIVTNGTDPVVFAGQTRANGGILVGNVGIEFTEVAGDPSCGAGDYKVAANSSTTRFVQCRNGTIYSLLGGPSASVTDNALVRYDGTGGLVQDSAFLTATDNGQLTLTGSGTGNANGATITYTDTSSSSVPSVTALAATANGGYGFTNLFGGSILADASNSTGALTATGMQAIGKKSGSGALSAATALRTQIQNANATGAITTGVGIEIAAGTNSGGGITTLVGMDIGNQTAGTTNWSMRIGTAPSSFGGPLLFTSPATQSLTADSSTISCAATFNKLSATATRNLTSDPQIANPQGTGALCILEATGANTIQLDDGTGVQLDGGTAWVGDADDVIALLYNGTDWLELYRANH